VNVLLFGATGMIGQGVLRECLLDPTVTRVVSVSRRTTGKSDPKLREFVQSDVTDLSPLGTELKTVDACLFTLGISSVGQTEEEYSRATYDLAMRVAEQLVRANPSMTFIYVSGRSTDSTEKGSAMWARVKGRLENALLKLGFARAYMFRPAAIIPQHGIRSSTGWYNALYAMAKPLFPIVRRMSPTSVTTTDQLSRAMITVARDGYSKPILEMADIIAF
jgi:uncharacterized protein YbjT (DUF2867 family)